MPINISAPSASNRAMSVSVVNIEETGQLKDHLIGTSPSPLLGDRSYQKDHLPQKKGSVAGFEAAPQQHVTIDNSAEQSPCATYREDEDFDGAIADEGERASQRGLTALQQESSILSQHRPELKTLLEKLSAACADSPQFIPNVKNYLHKISDGSSTEEKMRARGEKLLEKIKNFGFDGKVSDENVDNTRKIVSRQNTLSPIEGISSEKAQAIEADELKKIREELIVTINNKDTDQLEQLVNTIFNNDRLTPQLKADFKARFQAHLGKESTMKNATKLVSAAIKGDKSKVYMANSVLIAGALMELVGFIMAMIKVAGSHQPSAEEPDSEADTPPEVQITENQIKKLEHDLEDNDTKIAETQNQLSVEERNPTDEPEIAQNKIDRTEVSIDYQEKNIQAQAEKMGEKGYFGKSLEDIHQEATERETLKSMQAGNQGYNVTESGDRGDAQPDTVALREGQAAGDAAYTEAEQMQQKYQADQATLAADKEALNTFNLQKDIINLNSDNQDIKEQLATLQEQETLLKNKTTKTTQTTPSITEKKSYSDAFISLMSLGGVFMAGSLTAKGGWSRQASTAMVHALQRKKTSAPASAPVGIPFA